MSQRILFIDDEDIVLRSCRRIFAKEDLALETAVSGEEGLEKARAEETGGLKEQIAALLNASVATPHRRSHPS